MYRGRRHGYFYSIAFQYPENPTDMDKQKYYTYLLGKKRTTMSNCRHYQTNFEKLPINLESRKELIEWLIDLHNEVNIKNGKKVLSYNEVYKIYNDLYENKKNSYNCLKVIIVIAIIVILLLLQKLLY